MAEPCRCRRLQAGFVVFFFFFGVFYLHLSSHLMQDPRLFEIHGAISVKLEDFSNALVLFL